MKEKKDHMTIQGIGIEDQMTQYNNINLYCFTNNTSAKKTTTREIEKKNLFQFLN